MSFHLSCSKFFASFGELEKVLKKSMNSRTTLIVKNDVLSASGRTADTEKGSKYQAVICQFRNPVDLTGKTLSFDYRVTGGDVISLWLRISSKDAAKNLVSFRCAAPSREWQHVELPLSSAGACGFNQEKNIKGDLKNAQVVQFLFCGKDPSSLIGLEVRDLKVNP